MEVEIVTADPMCPGCERFRQTIEEVTKRYNELHRRCQLAEGAVLRKMKGEVAGGAPLAKRLAMAGYAAEQEMRLAADSLLQRASGRLADALEVNTGYNAEIGKLIEDIADYFNRQ
jgi:hypothetical protein